MHEKLIKQLRNTEHCGSCPYDEDCNEFDSCLMDLLAADAIEDMSKRIARLEKELQKTSISGIKIDGLSLPERGDMHRQRYCNPALSVNTPKLPTKMGYSG